METTAHDQIASDSSDPSKPPVDLGPWLHGTNKPFEQWTVPPPGNANNSLVVPHSAVFLTRHEDYAVGAGLWTCTAFLTPHAKVLVPGNQSKDSERMRKSLQRHPLASACIWLSDEATWKASWDNGEVMRFGAGKRVLNELVSRGARQLQSAYPGMQHEALWEHALHNITRGWIEEIVKAARALGFDAVQGHEIDRHAGSQTIARPWMAVFNSRSLTPPVWGPKQSTSLQNEEQKYGSTSHLGQAPARLANIFKGAI